MVRRPVVAGDAGSVQHEDHGLAVEPDVQVHLVDRPGQERRVERDHRPEPTHRHAGSAR